MTLVGSGAGETMEKVDRSRQRRRIDSKRIS